MSETKVYLTHLLTSTTQKPMAYSESWHKEVLETGMTLYPDIRNHLKNCKRKKVSRFPGQLFWMILRLNITILAFLASRCAFFQYYWEKVHDQKPNPCTKINNTNLSKR